MYGVCKKCGCTDNDPCFNPIHGNCWWVDDSHTLCSHCADENIANDPQTLHFINSEAGQIPDDAECCTCRFFSENDDGEFCRMSGEATCCSDKACVCYRQ